MKPISRGESSTKNRIWTRIDVRGYGLCAVKPKTHPKTGTSEMFGPGAMDTNGPNYPRRILLNTTKVSFRLELIGASHFSNLFTLI